MISWGAKIALGASLCFTSAIIFLVHEMQTADRKRLREGVIRDLERQEKKRRNLEELEQQIELTKKFFHFDLRIEVIRLLEDSV